MAMAPTADSSPPEPRPAGSPDGTRTPAPRSSPRRVVMAGAWTFLASAGVMFLPLLWGRWDSNRYFVAFGFVGACLGASFMLHGTWDWLKTRAGARKAERR